MDTALKKAGAMLAHLDLFHHMLHVRGLLQLAQHMEERGDRVTMVSPDNITLMGAAQDSAPAITTAKGATIEAGSAYTVLSTLKGHEAPEYAVTREELKALNARAVADIESSDAMRAFSDTLARVTAQDARTSEARTAPPEAPSAERVSAARARRGSEGEVAAVSAEN